MTSTTAETATVPRPGDGGCHDWCTESGDGCHDWELDHGKWSRMHTYNFRLFSVMQTERVTADGRTFDPPTGDTASTRSTRPRTRGTLPLTLRRWLASWIRSRTAHDDHEDHRTDHHPPRLVRPRALQRGDPAGSVMGGSSPGGHPFSSQASIPQGEVEGVVRC